MEIKLDSNTAFYKPLSKKVGKARIGVFGVGYVKYWAQFDGLLADMQEKQAVFMSMVEQFDVEVVDFGMVDDAQSAYDLVPRLLGADLDLIFCDMLTYATSSTFGAIVKNIQVPLILVALQPDKALNYEQASTYKQLFNDDI